MAKFLKRSFLALVVLLIVAVALFLTFAPAYVESSRNTIEPHDPFQVSDQAAKLHQSLTIGDWHADSLLWKRDLLKRGTRGQVDIPRLQDGNVTLQVFTAVTKSPAGQNYSANATDARDNITPLAVGQLWPARTWQSIFQRAMYQAEKLHEFADQAPTDLMIVKSRDDLERLLSKRKNGETIVGGMLGLEGAHPLEGDIAKLTRLADAGYRVVGLQHFFDNALGGSLHGTSNQGLSDFGTQVVKYIENNNLVLDLAHSSPQVARDVLAISNMPIIVSHTGIYSHCQTKRNFPDDLMKQIAQTGGVIAIGYWADVTCDASPMGVAATIKAAITLVGDDAVSLGSDYDGSVETGFDTSELPALTQALLDQGLSESQIRKVMGQNMLRVLRDRLE